MVAVVVDGVGGEAPAASMLQRFRQRTAAQAAKLNPTLDAGTSVCDCVNIAGMQTTQHSPGASNLDSLTDYGWIKVVHPKEFPVAPFESIVTDGIAAWQSRLEVAKSMNISQYMPPLSTSWDSSPRTMPTDPFGSFGYPWGKFLFFSLTILKLLR